MKHDSHQGTEYRVGIISDTHGLMRPGAVAALHGSDIIIHAGDIGESSVLETLARIAPVLAVRGNNDHGAWAENLPEFRIVTAAGELLCVLHNVTDLEGVAKVSGSVKWTAVIAGHSH